MAIFQTVMLAIVQARRHVVNAEDLVGFVKDVRPVVEVGGFKRNEKMFVVSVMVVDVCGMGEFLMADELRTLVLEDVAELDI